MDPFLPDIIQSVVGRIGAKVGFPVFFDKGNLSQVSKSVAVNNSFPLVWLRMPFTAKRGDPHLYGVMMCDLFIAMPTDSNYTQQLREDINYKPKLLPVYQEFLRQLQIEKKFWFTGIGAIEHSMTIMPYWGGGAIEGTNAKNMFEKEIDAIGITGLKLTVRKNC